MRAPLALALAALAVSPPALAHGMRTALVEVSESQPGQAFVRLHRTAPDPGLAVEVSSACTLDPYAAASQLDQVFTLTCPGGLRGQRIGLAGLGPLFSDAVLRVSFADGTSDASLLSTDTPFRDLDAGSAWAVLSRYVGLGVRHILGGADHLLFLLLLVLALRRPRAVLLAESAFTLSHSLSFAATALGWIRVSAPAAEACIALSLLLMALDVGRPGAPVERASRGALLALVFGLVHGLGFAGGLREIGLPEHDIATALVGFGGGVEVGQIAFLGVALGLAHLGQRARRWEWVVRAAGSAAGVTGAYWFIDRLWGCFLAGGNT